MSEAARLADSVLGTIPKHDRTVTSSTIALLRAINDVVLGFPGLNARGGDVAIPLRLLAGWWVASSWPFVAEQHLIPQGPQPCRQGALRNDMSFRPHLTACARRGTR